MVTRVWKSVQVIWIGCNLSVVELWLGTWHFRDDRGDDGDRGDDLTDLEGSQRQNEGNE